MTTKRFEEGLAVRREVLGSEYVDKSMAEMDDFTQPFQELVNEYCWGSARPAISTHARSCAFQRTCP